MLPASELSRSRYLDNSSLPADVAVSVEGRTRLVEELSGGDLSVLCPNSMAETRTWIQEHSSESPEDDFDLCFRLSVAAFSPSSSPIFYARVTFKLRVRRFRDLRVTLVLLSRRESAFIRAAAARRARRYTSAPFAASRTC